MVSQSLGSSSGDAAYLDRLSRYLDVVVHFRGATGFSRAEFLDRADFVSGATLRADLQSLGLDGLDDLDPVALETAIRRQLDRSEYPTVTLQFPNITRQLPNPQDIITSTSAARNAAAVETAFQISTLLSTHLDGHGAMSDGLVAHRHQLETARKVTREIEGNVIIADEVGLGKTITAGLIIADLLSSDPDATILILVPSNIRTQWANELYRFFGFDFGSRTGSHRVEHLAHSGQLLLPVDRAKRADWRKILFQREWDWLILDEAHDIRNPGSDRARFIFSLNARRRVYLTATPVHNTAYDIYHLINSLRPGFLGSRSAFAEEFLEADGGIRDPVGLQQTLAQVMVRTRRRQTHLPFPKREIRHLKVRNRQTQESRLYTDVLRLLRGIYRRHLGPSLRLERRATGNRAVEQTVIVAMLVLKELGSHPRAALATLRGALRERVRVLAKATGDTSDLQQLDATLNSYENTTWPRGSHEKTDVLLRLLPSIINKHHRAIIYVHYRETKNALKELVTHLIDSGQLSHCLLLDYYGDMSPRDKVEAVVRFTEAERSCLISTDAGGTGLNLQAASAVINFDFPWNPMIVEQRIGRVDRIGQQRDTITIYNLITEGTIEMYVYSVLQEKLDVCHDILGNIESPLMDELLRRPEEFGIGNIILASEDDADMATRFEELRTGIDYRQRQRGIKIRRPTGWQQ